MAVPLIHPDGHPQITLYHHVVVATGSKPVHIAGQVAWDENRDLVAPGDLTRQVPQVYRHLVQALDAARATFHDVVRITWYATGWKKEMYEAFNAGVEQAAREFDFPTPLAAVIGVNILFEPGILVAAEATAIAD